MQLEREAQMATTTRSEWNTDANLRLALDAVRDRLSENRNIDRIVLYGSFAWGKPDPESDVDLLILLKDPVDLKTQNRISKIIFEINLDFDTNLSELIVDRQAWDHGMLSELPIHRAIENRGIRL